MFTIIGGDGKEYGPVSVEQLRQWMAANRVNLDTQVRPEGSAEWRRLGDVPPFATPPAAGETAATPTPAAPAATRPVPIEFTGEWTEYFKIWIVNILLTIVTLGLYAAWAKVRRRRYFHANTRLFGHAFEYLADPVRILLGNLLIGAIFLGNAVLGAISPLLQIPFIIAFIIAVPWFVTRAFAFNARNTAWRGLRFMFNGRYGEAALIYLLLPLAVPFTLGLLQPYVLRRQQKFIIDHHHYGTTPFVFSARVGEFYRIMGITLLFFLPLIIAYGGIFATAIAQIASRGRTPSTAALWFLPFLFVGLPLAFVGASYLRSKLFNLVWNNTTIAGHRFTANMGMGELLGLTFVNALVTVFTAGLLSPWATVRLVKFQLSKVQVVPAGSVDDFVAAAQPPVTAIGDVATDFFDIDLGFGL